MTIRIPIVASLDPKGFTDADKAMGGFSKKALKIGGLVTAAFAAIAAAVVLPIKALLELGQAFDDAYDKIRIGTGATNAALSGLQDSFRNVLAEVPNSFEDISTAIADLNTRTGATGKDLEDLAVHLLTIARLFDEDVGETVRNTTRLFGQLNIPMEEQEEVLGKLFRASQASGAGFNEMTEAIREAMPELRAFGFTTDESIALIARLEREGVSASDIISGLGRAARTLTNEGVPLKRGLQDLIIELQTLDDQAARARGFEVFGRSAVGIVDAIRSGKFDLEEMVRIIGSGGDTALIAAAETDGLREAWDRFKNYLKGTFEPVANQVFAAAEGLIAELEPAVDRVMKAFEEEGLEGALRQVAEEWDRIYHDPEIGLEALWNKFLEFMNTYVVPEVKRLGIVLGEMIFQGVVNGFNNAMKRIGVDFIADLVPNIPFIQYYPQASSTTSTYKTSGEFVRMAEGGIVTRPIFPALIGEAGPEAVIPLDEFGSMGSTVININVTGAIDPEGTARTILRALRDSERRTGARL